MIPAANVLISVITRDYVYAGTVRWLCQQRYPVHIIQTPYTIEHQRNLQIAEFLKTKAEWLFIVDADVVPRRGTIEVLLEDSQPRKVRVAPPWAFSSETKKRHPMAYNRHDDGLFYPVSYEADAGEPQVCVSEVDLSGMSGALLPRKLLEGLHRPWFKMTHDDQGFLVATEDVYFWKSVQDAGYIIEAWLNLTADHSKIQLI